MTWKYATNLDDEGDSGCPQDGRGEYTGEGCDPFLGCIHVARGTGCDRCAVHCACEPEPQGNLDGSPSRL